MSKRMASYQELPQPTRQRAQSNGVPALVNLCKKIFFLPRLGSRFSFAPCRFRTRSCKKLTLCNFLPTNQTRTIKATGRLVMNHQHQPCGLFNNVFLRDGSNRVQVDGGEDFVVSWTPHRSVSTKPCVFQTMAKRTRFRQTLAVSRSSKLHSGRVKISMAPNEAMWISFGRGHNALSCASLYWRAQRDHWPVYGELDGGPVQKLLPSFRATVA